MRTLLSMPIIMLLALFAITAAQAAVPSVPSPALSPQQVVTLQLDALHQVDKPAKDAGFATVFRFTSPENQAQTGPLSNFSRMIRQGFGELINHRRSKLLPAWQESGRVIQPVEITSLAGRSYRYVFVLRQQTEGEYRGCWMTDGVVPQDDGSGASQEL